MAVSKYYFLSDRKRYFKFPFKLKEVGWLPGHYYSHKNAVLKDIYVCMTCNATEESCTEKNGILTFSKYESDKIHFSLIEPGTRFHTIKPATHDELYFRFDLSCADAVRNFVGQYTSFYFLKWPHETMTELQRLLHQLDKEGVADKVDQLAVRLISEVILQYIEISENENNSLQMRIFSVANDIVNGKKLQSAVRDNGFSMRTFYREWNRHFGVSPKDYVMQKKLEKAEQLLTETDLTNIEIARQCGFDNVKYFYNWFRKNFNMTPREYKLAQQNRQSKLDM